MSTPPFVALPRGVERVTLPGDAGRLACLIAMPETASRGSAVLVPGLTGSKEDFIAMLPLLREDGWAAAALDLRGQYESGCAAESRFGLSDFAADVVALMAELHSRTGDPIHLLGHSFGGFVARTVAMQATEPNAARTTPPLASLTFLCSGPGALPKEVQPKLAPLIEYLPDAPLELIWTAKEAMDRADGWVPPSEQVAEFLRRRFIASDPRALRAKAILLTEEADRVGELRAATLRSALPVNVIYGEHDDAWTPAEQDDMARRLAARRVLFPRTGHSPNADRPEWLTGTLGALWAECGDEASGSRSDVAWGDLDHQDSDKKVGRTGLTSPSDGYLTGMDARFPVPRDAAAVGKVRRCVGRMLRAWGIDCRIADAELMCSELITNAVRYGHEPIEARMSLYDDVVRFEVHDAHAHSLPIERAPGVDSAGGYGIPLVAALSQAWGVEAGHTGKIVWAEIPR